MAIKNIRQLLLGVAVAGISTLSHGQIPVTDVALNGQTAANQIATMAQWAQQIAEMKLQYEELQRQWDKMDVMERAVTGTRGMGTADAGGVNAQLPVDIRRLYTGSYGETNAIMDSERVTVADDATKQALSERSFRVAAVETSLSRNAYQGGIERLDSIHSLLAKINQTKDPKAIADLQARIQAEEALIQNEQSKLQMLAKASDAENKMIVEKRRQMSQAILNPNNTEMPGIK